MISDVLLVSILVCAGFGSGRIIKDLTHTLTENPPHLPLAGLRGVADHFFQLKTIVDGDYGNTWVKLQYIELHEHVGTHMDPPAHFGMGREAMDAIAPNRLIGPGVIIDVKEKAALDPDYMVNVEDIAEYELRYGRIPPDAIVIMNSGWSKYYNQPKLMFSSETPDIWNTTHFPAWHIDAVTVLLTQRRVSVVGVDTPSVDSPASLSPVCHVYLNSNSVPLIQNVANLDTIPPNGTTIILGSIKTQGGTGGPVRVLAIIDEDKDVEMTGKNRSKGLFPSNLLFVSLIFFFFRPI